MLLSFYHNYCLSSVALTGTPLHFEALKPVTNKVLEQQLTFKKSYIVIQGRKKKEIYVFFSFFCFFLLVKCSPTRSEGEELSQVLL